MLSSSRTNSTSVHGNGGIGTPRRGLRYSVPIVQHHLAQEWRECRHNLSPLTIDDLPNNFLNCDNHVFRPFIIGVAKDSLLFENKLHVPLDIKLVIEARMRDAREQREQKEERMPEPQSDAGSSSASPSAGPSGGGGQGEEDGKEKEKEKEKRVKPSPFLSFQSLPHSRPPVVPPAPTPLAQSSTTIINVEDDKHVATMEKEEGASTPETDRSSLLAQFWAFPSATSPTMSTTTALTATMTSTRPMTTTELSTTASTTAMSRMTMREALSGLVVALYLPSSTERGTGLDQGPITIARLRILGYVLRQWRISHAIVITDVPVRAATEKRTRSIAAEHAVAAASFSTTAIVPSSSGATRKRTSTKIASDESLKGFRFEFRRSDDFLSNPRINTLVPRQRRMTISEIWREVKRDGTIPHGWAMRVENGPITRCYGFRPGDCVEASPQTGGPPHVSFVYGMDPNDIPPFAVLVDAAVPPIAGVRSVVVPTIGLDYMKEFYNPT